MRAFFSREFMPSVHFSSFEAGKGLAAEEQETGDPTLLGFLEQTRNVLVGARAAVDRALEEGWSMVLEGVHLVPGMLPASLPGAIVVQCVLAISDEDVHSAHFFIRDRASDERRPVSKYVEHFGDIRRIQRYIVERARRTGVPVIENTGIDRAAAEVMELVVAAAEREQAVVR
jgi:2-phosphoglycerate kinase